jgi:glutamate synthase domain-containing protein 3
MARRIQGSQQANLTVGQTISITSTQGKYYVAGDASKNGTASGNVTFTVTGKLSAGWTVSITQGSIVVDGTTYAVSSGTAQMDRAASQLVGQGAATPSGQFLLQAAAYGSFAGTSASMSLDLNAGTTEYLVILSGTVKG